jgi:hypothetical protein
MVTSWFEFANSVPGRLLLNFGPNLAIWLASKGAGFLKMISTSTKTTSFVVYAGQVSSFRGQKNVTINDFKPHLMSTEMYTEQWSFYIWEENGRHIAVEFLVSNVGVGDHNVALVLKVEEPDGKIVKCKKEFEEDQWSSSKDSFLLEFGGNQLSGDLNSIRADVSCDNLAANLEFKNHAPPTSPGSGKLKFGEDDGVYSMLFPSPRSQVMGTIKHKSKESQVAGYGYAEQSYYDMPPYKQVRRWFRFKLVNKDISVILAEMESSHDYNNRRNGWALLSDEKGKIASTVRVSFDFDGFIKDKVSEEGYSIPRRVRFAAVDGNTNITGTLTMKKLAKKVDPIEDLDDMRRWIIRRFAKPIEYHLDCDYSIRIKDQTRDRKLKGEGIYSFMYVNP